MIKIFGKIRKSNILFSICKCNKSFLFYDSLSKSLIFEIPQGTDRNGLLNFNNKNETRNVVFDFINRIDDKKYEYLIIYSNSDKKTNDWIEQLLKVMQNKINLKFKDAILFINE